MSSVRTDADVRCGPSNLSCVECNPCWLRARGAVLSVRACALRPPPRTGTLERRVRPTRARRRRPKRRTRPAGRRALAAGAAPEARARGCVRRAGAMRARARALCCALALAAAARTCCAQAEDAARDDALVGGLLRVSWATPPGRAQDVTFTVQALQPAGCARGVPTPRARYPRRPSTPRMVTYRRSLSRASAACARASACGATVPRRWD
jgi:hypothetical protein